MRISIPYIAFTSSGVVVYEKNLKTIQLWLNPKNNSLKRGGKLGIKAVSSG